MKPDRFFVDEGNRQAYELGYADGVEVGKIHTQLDALQIRRDVEDELRKEFTRLKRERQKLHDERKERAKEKRELTSFRKYLRKQFAEANRNGQ